MTDNNDNVRAVGFESLMRRDPHIKRLASVWRNSPEYNTWMGLYLDPDNKNIEYFEEDNHQIGTFYRRLDELEVKNMTETIVNSEEEEPSTPGYEVIDVVHEHNDEEQSHKVTYVKLGIPRWIAIDGKFGLCEYVFVDQYRLYVDTAEPPFTFMTTRVMPTDEEQGSYDGADPIYQAPSLLEVWECMFAIGEYPTKEEENAD